MGNHQISRPVTRGFGLFESFLAQKRAAIANRLINNEQRKGRILDLGCGPSPYFLTLTKFKQKYGLDLQVEEDTFEDKNIILKRINLEKEKIPFADNYFHVITMLAFLEHLQPEKIPAIFKGIYRVLKRNGQLIITTPSSWSGPILFLLSRVGLISKVEIDDHKALYNRSRISKLLLEAGFSANKIKSGFFNPWLNMWFTVRK